MSWDKTAGGTGNHGLYQWPKRKFNLFLPRVSNHVEHAHLAEVMGRTEIAAEVGTLAVTDTGKHGRLVVGGPAQQQDYLQPLLAGDIRSGFAMTEPAVASSDAGNLAILDAMLRAIA